MASTPIRYSFGADEHLFAEVSDSMSLEAFSRAWRADQAVERLALEGVLDICLANASFQIRLTPTALPPRRCSKPCVAPRPTRWPSVR